MNIAAMSSVLSQAQVKQQASLAVLKSAMSTADTNASGLIDMMNQSVGQAKHPYLGNTIDMRA